ncbi:MAG: response regulator [Candidatus Hydrogenedentes bacterium]|nr:response regulator [Candidatus Hydrogenedentota bacterium]
MASGEIEVDKKATPTLLLVEDDDVDAERVIRAAQRAGAPFIIRRASNGVEALAVLRGEIPPVITPPLIVLLDLRMPQMGGLQFLGELRKDGAFRGIVVFVMTTSHSDEDRRAAYDKFVAGYIPKYQSGGDFGPVIQMLSRYIDVVELA